MGLLDEHGHQWDQGLASPLSCAPLEEDKFSSVAIVTGTMRLEEMLVYLWEEWGLLDEVQGYLYHSMNQKNLALTFSNPHWARHSCSPQCPDPGFTCPFPTLLSPERAVGFLLTVGPWTLLLSAVPGQVLWLLGLGCLH